MSTVNALFNPTSVAVVGASSDPAKLTGRPIAYLQRNGFAGQIYPINPRYESIGELPCFPDAASLPAAPDVGLILLGANRVVDSVRQLAAIGTKASIVLASGFGETGAEGLERQAALLEAAGDMRLLGPNTIGLVNLTDRVMLSASGALELSDFPAGNVALVSQSGGILGSLLSRAVARGIGFSKLVATGNEVDLDVADFIDQLADDPASKVIALYLETIRRPEAFRAAAARAIAAGKAIVAYKVGRSEAGARSAVSHTGALAGADQAYEALFRQSGIIRAQTFSDLLDIPTILSSGRRLADRRVAILTSTGGAATIVADNIGLSGLETPVPDEPTSAALRELEIVDAVLDRNPIDVTLAGLKPELFRRILTILAESASYDAIVVVVGSSSIGQPSVVAEPLLETVGLSNKPVLAYVSPDAPEIVRYLNARGVPAFANPESCAAALSALNQVGQVKVSSEEALTHSLPDIDHYAGTLNEHLSKQLFAAFGIPGAREVVAGTPEEAASAASSFDGAIVLKVLSSHILHKSDIGGVAVGLHPRAVLAEAQKMTTALQRLNTEPEGFLVQQMISGGTEMILGFARDPQLGGYVLLGAGGVTTEIYQDTVIRMLPIDRPMAVEMIDALKSSPLLKGFRGRPHGDTEALADAIVAFGRMATALGDRLQEAEINPLFVLPKGQGVSAADGLVILD